MWRKNTQSNSMPLGIKLTRGPKSTQPEPQSHSPKGPNHTQPKPQSNSTEARIKLSVYPIILNRGPNQTQLGPKSYSARVLVSFNMLWMRFNSSVMRLNRDLLGLKKGRLWDKMIEQFCPSTFVVLRSRVGL